MPASYKDGDFYKVDGFIIYREFVSYDTPTGAPDLVREQLAEYEDEKAAIQAVAEFEHEYPDDDIFYEEGTITV